MPCNPRNKPQTSSLHVPIVVQAQHFADSATCIRCYRPPACCGTSHAGFGTTLSNKTKHPQWHQLQQCAERTCLASVAGCQEGAFRNLSACYSQDAALELGPQIERVAACPLRHTRSICCCRGLPGQLLCPVQHGHLHGWAGCVCSTVRLHIWTVSARLVTICLRLHHIGGQRAACTAFANRGKQPYRHLLHASEADSVRRGRASSSYTTCRWSAPAPRCCSP